MSLIQGTTGFSFRERSSNDEAGSIYSPVANKQWLNDLPMANLGETSRRVYHRLLKSNKEHIDIKVRAALLDSLIASVEHICNSLTRHYIVHNVSLTTKQKKIADLCQALQLEMTIGFKYIIEDLCVDGKYSHKLLIIAINYALYYFHRVQIHCYQLYTDLPKGMWKEIHLLYQLAENNQLLNNKLQIDNGTLTASSTYKKMLLLATTNPNQLRQLDIKAIVNALDHFTSHCDIDSIVGPTSKHDFVVNLNSDLPPFHHSLIKEDLKPHYRIIQTQEIIKKLQHALGLSSNAFELNHALIQNLIQVWGTTGARAFTRVPTTQDLQVSVGLSGCHYIINRELYGEDPLIKTRHNIQDSKKAYQFMKYAVSNSNEPTYDYKNATIINLSPGSYCLKLVGTLPRQTQAGEIIGLIETSKEGVNSWNIGNIRWMQKNDDGDLNLGVQLIGPNAEPVLGQVITDNKSIGKVKELSFQRCLLLPEISSIDQPASIITSPVPFATNHQLQIKSHKGSYKISLTRIISEGHGYKQFEYVKVEANISKGKATDATTGFDSVWELL